ncbi:MAG TPA: hypothetical protein RMH26_26370 [Polyangiaceae bacterium LLY-WYZ-15_(1-7)]|nr:hypothetical protein [Polyangiaceae bacterium LLY-WYZ-15_(1-7)]
MGFGYRRLPEEVVLGRTSKQVFEILVKHTSFPWPVMKAQARRIDADPANLSPADVKALVENIADAVGRFTTPQKRDAVADALRALAP